LIQGRKKSLALLRIVSTHEQRERIAPLLPGKASDPGVTAKTNRLFVVIVDMTNRKSSGFVAALISPETTAIFSSLQQHYALNFSTVLDNRIGILLPILTKNLVELSSAIMPTALCCRQMHWCGPDL
jgi:hypothetical protein